MGEFLEGFDLGWDGSGEGVVGEVEGEKRGGVEEVRRDGVGEVVVWEREVGEVAEEPDFGGDVAGEPPVWERDGGDAIGGACDSDPLAGSWVGVFPGGQNVGWVGGDGGFEGEEREAVGG